MAAGPTREQVNRAMRRANTVAGLHEERSGLVTKARFIQASNGEAAIVYDVTGNDGIVRTFLSVKDAEDVGT